jgi:electron transport complex protein RnfG
VTTAYTAGRTSLRSGIILLLFALVFTAMMALVFELTRPTIAASTQAEKMKLIDEILSPGSYDNPLLEDFLELGPTPELGLAGGGRLYRARQAGQPVALVVELTAPDGYAGRIDLVAAIRVDGQVSGVRVVSHKETPGLGDYIDPRKDKDRQRPWITRFNDLSLAGVGAGGWKLKKDGGPFDYHVGATISARAVTNAVGRALAYVAGQGDALYATPTPP